jgi:hypothetical protein
VRFRTDGAEYKGAVVTLDEDGGLIDYKNNWCASQMARDATTGELIWAFNMTPADNWDLDEPLNTPLELAIKFNHPELEAYLRSLGALPSLDHWGQG